MKIGILSLNFSWHGEATAAATRCMHLKQQGYDVELFTFSKSGKVLKRMRTDYEFTVLKSKDVGACLEFLHSKDIIVSFGTGIAGEDEFETPAYHEPLKRMRTPLVAYVPIQGELLFKAYPHSEDFLKFPTVCATMFPRDSLRKFCYENPQYKKYFEHLPFLVSKRPIDMSGVKLEPRYGKKFVCTTRIAPSKKTKLLLQAIRDFDLTKIADIEIWGDKGESRYGYLLEEEFGDLFSSLYKGPYTHRDLDRIYADSRYFFDLTNFAADGGDVQNTFLEGVTHGAVAIVPPGWNVNSSCIELPELTPAAVAAAVKSAIDTDESLRIQLLASAHSHIRSHHDPKTITAEFHSWAAGLAGSRAIRP